MSGKHLLCNVAAICAASRFPWNYCRQLCMQADIFTCFGVVYEWFGAKEEFSAHAHLVQKGDTYGPERNWLNDRCEGECENNCFVLSSCISHTFGLKDFILIYFHAVLSALFLYLSELKVNKITSHLWESIVVVVVFFFWPGGCNLQKKKIRSGQMVYLSWGWNPAISSKFDFPWIEIEFCKQLLSCNLKKIIASPAALLLQ